MRCRLEVGKRKRGLRLNFGVAVVVVVVDDLVVMGRMGEAAAVVPFSPRSIMAKMSLASSHSGEVSSGSYLVVRAVKAANSSSRDINNAARDNTFCFSFKYSK